jgi:hypothetical protein
MAAMLIADGKAERGMRLAGAVSRIAERAGVDADRLWDINRPWLDVGRRKLGPRASAAWAAGRRMTFEQARDFALEIPS